MYIDWNLNSGFQAFDFTEQEAQLENIRWIKENAPEYYDATVQAMGAQAGFADRQLDQAWKIAQMGESGATSRAGIAARSAASNARTAANASMSNAKTAAAASKYGVDVGRLTDQEKIALERELGYADVGLKQGQLGLDYTKASADMHGAYNPFAESDILHGGPDAGNVPRYLSALLNNVSPAAFQAPVGAPAGYNMQNMIAGAAGQPLSGGVGPQNNGLSPALMAAKQAAQQGAHTWTQGSLERMTEPELGAFKSAVEYSGDPNLPSWNWSSLLKQYQAAKPGQGNPYAA